MRFVHDQRVVPQQQRIVLDLAQQQAVGHELDERARTGSVDEPDLVADEIARGRADLGADPIRQRLRGDASRLRVADHSKHTTPGFQADLGQLRALAAAGGPTHDHHLRACDGCADFIATQVHRQGVVVANRRHRGTSRLDLRDRRLHPGLESRQLTRIGTSRQPVQRAPEPRPVAQQAARQQFAQRREPRGDIVSGSPRHRRQPSSRLACRQSVSSSSASACAGCRPCFCECRFHVPEPPLEFGVRIAQRTFGVDPEVPRSLRQAEQHVAEFRANPGPVSCVANSGA